MKRTDKLTNLIAILLFVALVAYLGAYAFRSLRGVDVTAEAVAAEFDIGGTASGIVLRDETVLTADEPYVDVAAAEGARVAAGSLLATAIRSDLGRERAGRMHELELEISRMSAALSRRASADDLTSRDETLRSSVSSLCSAVARHRLDTLDGDVLNLSSLLFPADAESVSEAELKKLQKELDSLKSSTGGDATPLYAESAGSFSSAVDGYECFSLADVEGLTPSGLASLIETGGSVPAGTYGKLVHGYQWYFAAVMDAVDAANLTVGRSATLNFGRWYSADVAAKVMDISAREDGSVVVIFRCSTALADTLAMRVVSATVVFESYDGIRLPAQAVHTDEEAESTYVWCVTAMQLERKDVEIIYCDEDFVIVSYGSAADSLRPGNTVVVTGKDLHEGKVFGE